MKTLSIIIISLIIADLKALELPVKEINTDVNEVTVFIQGAQVVRKKNISLEKGKTILKFIELSPFIDSKSVQVRANGELTVLSVNHQLNYVDKLRKSEELERLESEILVLEEKMVLEQTYLSIIDEELIFLKTNKDIGGRTQEVSVDNLRDAMEFYSKQLTELKLKEIERNKVLKKLKEQIAKINKQISAITTAKDYPTSEILVKLDAHKAEEAYFELSYLVNNAGWYPSYDIRAKNINEPVKLVYKANVKQDTKVDWNNAKLRFASSNPNLSGIAPELKTYILNYYTTPPTYNKTINTISGRITDQDNQPLPGANILIQGTTIGTVADLDGRYSLSVPENASNVLVSYIGYHTEEIPINNSTINVHLIEDMMALEEVVVVGYGTQKKESLTGTVTNIQGSASGIQIRGTSTLNNTPIFNQPKPKNVPVPTIKIENQTAVEFEIDRPFTVKSDNKNYTVEMVDYELPAYYQYFSVPKIDQDAFLIAHVIDWEKYNLLEGEANVFFEDTYIDKTLLDVRYASDTLDISLGRDKQVSVDRQKIKEFTTKKLIGSKKEDVRAWQTIVKNNKNQPINMVVLDQVPVSTLEEIEVEVLNKTGAKLQDETGFIKWEFELEPGKKKEFELKYAVKYPKYRTLVIE
ncbi:MAG: DUF4139 domain-containing protein [Bacteroidales bacterium]|nr:DUF4139 domain-containing protein [Bacteroidales bacterium]MBN2819580.1 DUF4139 domain-containing protein [Bacteroidales bacterium]